VEGAKPVVEGPASADPLKRPWNALSFCYYSPMGVPQRAGSDRKSLALAEGQLQTGTMRKSFA